MVRLVINHRECECGDCGGKYIDYLNAVYYGEGIPFGFNNSSFVGAIRERPENSVRGKEFTAFTIPEKCETMERVSRDYYFDNF